MELIERIKKIKLISRSLSSQAKLTLLITSIVVAGLLAEGLSQFGFKSVDINDPRILVARRDLEKGTVLTQLDLTTNTATDKEREAYFTDQQLPLVLGSKIRFGMKRGQYLAFELLELSNQKRRMTDQIPAGFRAYSFTPENELPVRVGDTIDLLNTDETSKTPPHTVASGVEILDLKRLERGTTLVVSVPEDELSRLEKARQSGKIVIALRGSKEAPVVRNTQRSTAKHHRKSLPKKVHVIIEEDT